jgi:hypothetical protein
MLTFLYLFVAASLMSAATPDFSLSLYGPPPVYAGYAGSGWAIITLSIPGGYNGPIYIETISPPAGITFVPWCGETGGTYGLGSKNCWHDAASKRVYQYEPGSPKSGASMVFSIHATNVVVPGIYNVDVGLTIGSGTSQVNHSIAVPVRVVVAVPAPRTMHQIAPIPSIPGLSKWEQTMKTDGAKWCTRSKPTNFIYSSTGESLSDYRSIWYYDGGRVYFQVADYTGDATTWDQCAYWVLDDYADHIVSSYPGRGVPLGNQVFAKGLFMGWQRSGDQKYLQALQYLMTNTPYSLPGGMMLNPIQRDPDGSRDPGLRETALMGNVYLYATKSGILGPEDPKFARLQRNAEWLLLYFDQTFVENNPMSFDQAFYDGMAAEFLIQYQEFTQDPRVLPAIKAMLDFHWTRTVDTATGRIQYSTFRSDQRTTSPLGFTVALCGTGGGCPTIANPDYVSDLTNLLAPAFAWYWSKTGDKEYLERGDLLFSHALDNSINDKAKSYSQNFYWSVDYVHWRSRFSIPVRRSR